MKELAMVQVWLCNFLKLIGDWQSCSGAAQWEVRSVAFLNWGFFAEVKIDIQSFFPHKFILWT